MDIQLKKRPWYIRYKYYLLAAIAFVAFLVYVIMLSAGPRKQRIETESIQISTVETGRFMEYVDVEGLVQPILTIQVNTKESGSVDRIVAEEGTMIAEGDTILTLINPQLTRSIEDKRDDFQKQLVNYREREIEMEQQTLTLRQQILQARYEQKRLKKNYELAKEEYSMGIKSKAELEVAEEEYYFKNQTASLQMESLRHDSVVSNLRRQMLIDDLERERKKLARELERQEDLVVRAPISGQLSFIKVTPGQQVGSSNNIGEIKVLSQYKIHTSLSEYYIDRITTGLPATILYQGVRFPLKITKVNPEVKDRSFDIDLVFNGDMPDNVRVGKSYRVQIELGQPEEAVVIPRGDFYQATGGQWIYKLNEAGDKAYRTSISIGRQNPQLYEITSGLNPGDRVITTGYDQFGEAEVLVLKK
ncbi:MAG: HlyD family efflux transporter periplasmic adaptor subunit [Bacteroidaceae bacterium]|nr:HlyD family efflux transporter periplasmic adaptor subunit [Bacteroidaceae bacterium]